MKLEDIKIVDQNLMSNVTDYDDYSKLDIAIIGMAFEFPQANTIMSFVSEGVGVTITFSTVYREAKCAGVKMIPLEDELHSVISLFYRKNKPLDYAKKQFLNYVREHLYT